MDFELQLLERLLPVLSEKGWVTSLLAIVTLRLWRRNRYLSEALRRANEQNIRLQNETQKKLLEAFLRGPSRTLRDLVENTDEEWNQTP